MIYKYINIDKNRKNALNKLFKNNLIMNLPFKKFFFKVRAKRYIIPKTLFFKYKLSSVKVGFKKRHPKLYISKYKISKYKISKYKISKYKISKYKISKYKKKIITRTRLFKYKTLKVISSNTNFFFKNINNIKLYKRKISLAERINSYEEDVLSPIKINFFNETKGNLFNLKFNKVSTKEFITILEN
jgi:hypothetical protein